MGQKVPTLENLIFINSILESLQLSILKRGTRELWKDLCNFFLPTYQRWSLRERPWPPGCPRGHILKSLALASKPVVHANCTVLGSRTALFFKPLKFC